MVIMVPHKELRSTRPLNSSIGGSCELRPIFRVNLGQVSLNCELTSLAGPKPSGIVIITIVPKSVTRCVDRRKSRTLKMEISIYFDDNMVTQPTFLIFFPLVFLTFFG